MSFTIRRPLSGNMLKWIAALFMVIDHVGYIFFPGKAIFRILGRLSFPIFAFMIAEGCRYTKHKIRYFLSVFLLAFVCQVAYYITERSLFMCVLVTFSLSILTIYAMQHMKDTFCSGKASVAAKLLSAFILIGVMVFVYVVNLFVEIDYGFAGCMLPVFAALPSTPRKDAPQRWLKFDTLTVRILFLGVGLVFLALSRTTKPFWSLLSLPFLFLYSGKRGKRNMKYFFYVFYPLHLLLLEGLHILLK